MPTSDSHSSDEESISATNVTATNATVTAACLVLQVSPTPKTGNDSRKLLELLSPEKIQQMLRIMNDSLEVIENQFNAAAMLPVPAACLQKITIVCLLYLQHKILLPFSFQWAAIMNLLWQSMETANFQQSGCTAKDASTYHFNSPVPSAFRVSLTSVVCFKNFIILASSAQLS